MNETSHPKEELLQSLPLEWPVDLRSEIRRELEASGRKVIVLDDDPTGTQTVHNVPVLTGWRVEDLEKELRSDSPLFYILTNSRSLSLSEARSLNVQIGRNLLQAGRKANREYVVVSRSDSTLRGHYPGEVEALAGSLGGRDFDAWVLVPFFLEGGRFTVGDIHYVDEKGMLVPAGKTEFAGDRVFGYRSSNLKDWVEEKTGGRFSAHDVMSISIEDLRKGGPLRVEQQLTTLKGCAQCVVNAASYHDIEVFVRGLLASEAKGKRFLYRTAASFVQVRAGLTPRPLLSPQELNLSPSGGGLIIVGSHVPRSTSQLEPLLQVPGISSIEVNVASLLTTPDIARDLERIGRLVEEALQDSRDIVLYTSRKQHVTADPQESLQVGRKVSEALVTILAKTSTRPRYLLAKGGITSSDIATRGLHVKRALVLGQILPGVPVWQLGPESLYPGLPYILFPGNVGDSEAVAHLVTMLGRAPA